MSIKVILGATGIMTAGLLLPACGGGDSPSATTMGPTQIKAETSVGVLALAKVASETGDPLTVGTDAIAAADLNDESSDPIPVG